MKASTAFVLLLVLAALPARVQSQARQVTYEFSGQWLVSIDQSLVKTWDTTDGTRAARVAIAGAWLLRTSPSKPLVAILRKDETVELRTLPALKPVRSWPTGNQYGTEDMAFSHDGATLATCAQMGAHWGVRFWDSDTGELRRELKGRCDRIAFSPDGRWIATARINGLQPEIKLWQASDLAHARTWVLYPEGSYFSLAFASNSNLLVAGWRAPPRSAAWQRKKDQYSYWRVPSDERTVEPGGPSGIETVAFGADANTMLSANGQRVRLWNLPAADGPLAFQPQRIELDVKHGPVDAIAASPDRSTFATAGRDGAIRTWRLADGSPVRELAEPADAPIAVAAVPSNAAPSKPSPAAQSGLLITGRLVTASGQPVAQRSLKLPIALPGKQGGLFYAFAPDFYEATTGTDGRFRFAGVKSGKRYALVDMTSGRPSPLRRSDGSTLLLEIAAGAKSIDLGDIRFSSD